MVMIGASILSADYGHMEQEVKKAEEGNIDFFHVDIMDGHFVPNLSMGLRVPHYLKSITDVPIDVHLMVENPELFIPKLADAADIIAFHAESSKYLFRTVDMIKEHDAKPIVALNPSTPIGNVEYVLENLYGVLVMTVEPGFSGQSFINPMLKKIDNLKNKILTEGYNTKIFVDGGINLETAPKAVEAGADALIAASAIYGKEDVKKAVNDLRNSANFKI
ncbi:ribulose-5-phosphate 3-epimerase [Methanococcus maripaludis C5]|uniref:Ribulose-phosphate 3-epimerase n=1 Tax=Methanococcus maripaludis (strain C5 / ATCC BAA-1333) TaxID=402880 RepID=A4FX55_METM5|nr:ribulose-phosphate 3-epimerase [Methanococcus maripaludis]ABO34784.1 ribulose-5-phosphate 3-epimerase [Methanococcus maripaludis C5]